MFTWWEGLPDGVGWGGDGRILLRARFRADHDGAHLIGGAVSASWRCASMERNWPGHDTRSGRSGGSNGPARRDPRHGALGPGQEAEIEVALLPSGGAPGPVSIRLGVVPRPTRMPC